MEHMPYRTAHEKRIEAERRKRQLAKSILAQIRYELTERPETEEFTYQLKESTGKLERFVLSHYPFDIADRIRPDHSVSLEIDQSVEPPTLTVRLGLRKPTES